MIANHFASDTVTDDRVGSGHKVLAVALAGAPNAGKSTLLNTLIGQKLAIVTKKVQTTRQNLRGILNIKETQLIFIDTPGLFNKKKCNNLEKHILRNAWNGIDQADLTTFIIDENDLSAELSIDRVVDTMHKVFFRCPHKEILVVINKIDKCNYGDYLKKVASLERSMNEKISGKYTIFNISAMNGSGVDNFVQYLISKAVDGPWFFDENMYTTSTEREIAEEATREKLYFLLQRELPYSIKVETEKWEEKEDDSIAIHHTIFVLKESQKMIIIGKGGKMIKKVGQLARDDISQKLHKKVHLFLFIKVRDNWIDKLES